MNLEDDIERLTELDDWRVKAAVMRDDGKHRLQQLPLSASAELIEHATVVKALLAHKPAPEATPLVAALEQLSLDTITTPGPDGVPVLRAAKVMCALAAAPTSAFSRAIMPLYYMVVRELYTADAPDWSIGGASAGEGMAPRAYVTWHCIRAVVGFRNALDHTAALLGAVADVLEQQEIRAKVQLPPQWEEVDKRRRNLELATTLKNLGDNIALACVDLSSLENDPTGAEFVGKLRADIAARRDEFEATKTDLDRLYEQQKDAEKKSGKSRHYARMATAHEIASGALQNAVDRAAAARDDLDDAQATPAARLRKLEKDFRDAARNTGKILQPATNYVLRVMNRELAGAAMSPSQVGWDAAEMAFAAVAYGEATQRWQDERLHRSCEHLLRSMSERGRFPLGRPLRTDDRGYQFHPLNGDVIRAVATVLRHVQSIDIDTSVARRMMTFFQDTQSPSSKGTWHRDENRPQKEPERLVTATAVLALNAINDMLDERINQLVFRHFSTKKPRQLTLPQLFYSDYGLVACAPDDLKRRDSIAVHMERMRAHVCGREAAGFEADPLFSLVLHGPPGTGKTMLVEALAASCDVTMVEVTPSDIVIGGEDQIERRTRAVFKALSLLTRAVVLFDEFDPVLLRRKTNEPRPSVFSFLTPGMLPKLKWLHDRAEKRSVAYVLITNLIEKLDDAAIRDGRFDMRIGVYPPDFLSRAGRLQHAVAQYHALLAKKNKERKPTDPTISIPSWPLEDRFHHVICNTAGAPMNTVGKRGWFTAPEQISPSATNAFAYLHGGATLTIVAAEAQFDQKRQWIGTDAQRERKEWSWVNQWDTDARKKTTIAESVASAPIKTPTSP